MRIMNKIYSLAGQGVVVVAVIFLLAHSFIAIKDPTESFSRDIFGLPIPTPPEWTSYIPYIGFVMGFLYEFFSLHGVVGLVIVVILFTIGAKLMSKDHLVTKKNYTGSEQVDKVFAALVRNEDHTFDVYLINPTDKYYTKVMYYTGGFASQDDDNLVETSRVVKDKGELPPHFALLIDKTDVYELDFVIWYWLDLHPYRVYDGLKKVSFSLPKGGYGDRDNPQFLPVLNKKGLRIELEERKNTPNIESQVVEDKDDHSITGLKDLNLKHKMSTKVKERMQSKFIDALRELKEEEDYKKRV